MPDTPDCGYRSSAAKALEQAKQNYDCQPRILYAHLKRERAPRRPIRLNNDARNDGSNSPR